MSYQIPMSLAPCRKRQPQAPRVVFARLIFDGLHFPNANLAIIRAANELAVCLKSVVKIGIVVSKLPHFVRVLVTRNTGIRIRRASESDSLVNLTPQASMDACTKVCIITITASAHTWPDASETQSNAATAATPGGNNASCFQ